MDLHSASFQLNVSTFRGIRCAVEGFSDKTALVELRSGRVQLMLHYAYNYAIIILVSSRWKLHLVLHVRLTSGAPVETHAESLS